MGIPRDQNAEKVHKIFDSGEHELNKQGKKGNKPTENN